VSHPFADQPKPRTLGLVAAVVTVFLLGVIMVSQGGRPIALVFPGERGAEGPLVAEFGYDAIPQRYPYDGMRTYQVAKHFPDIRGANAEGVADFRIKRILQPAIASVFDTGNGVVLALAALGAFGVGVATWALADLAFRHGRDPRLGFAALVALAFPAAITTTEPLAFGLALAGLALFDRDRLVAATALFAAAGLGRETALAAAAAAALVLLTRRRVLAAGVVGVFAVSPYALWSAYVSASVPATTDPTTQFLGIRHVADVLGPFDAAVALVGAALIVIAVVSWRDVPVLATTSAMFLAACLVYNSDSYRWHAFLRLSALGVALGISGGLGALSARGPRAEPPAADRSAVPPGRARTLAAPNDDT
jgi:hypothetical protein